MQPPVPRGYSAWTGRGTAAGATWIFRGDASRRGRDVDIPRRCVAAPPRLRRGYSAETRRGAATAPTWIFRGYV